ncbi:MAG TPA: anti-sigma regulatory factor [Steroidobacteraceae bacterium]|nr:anti-sigma regulatory factor [Steroidobacteraceae bacterium]
MASDIETFPVRSGEDVVRARQVVRSRAMECGFSLVEQTKIVTAASELARNTVIYGGGGDMRVERVQEGPKRTGLRLTFEDHGPGIADIELALRDGFTTGNGLGLGLNGARKLSHQFDIWSKPGAGTRVTITRWK